MVQIAIFKLKMWLIHWIIYAFVELRKSPNSYKMFPNTYTAYQWGKKVEWSKWQNALSFGLMLNSPVNNFSAMSGWFFLCWTRINPTCFDFICDKYSSYHGALYKLTSCPGLSLITNIVLHRSALRVAGTHLHSLEFSKYPGGNNTKKWWSW